MRLAQIARKVGVTPTDVKRFLESTFEIEIGKEPNYKLNEDQVNAVLAEFPIPEAVEETVEEQVIIPKDIPKEIEPVEEEVAELSSEVVEELGHTVEAVNDIEISEETEEETTEDDNVEEGNTDTEESEEEFYEAEVDPDAELIKAPKVKLDGLKILGKIELPEKKVEAASEKTEEELAQEEADAIASLDAAMQSQVQDIKTKPKKSGKADKGEDEEESEYKDKNGIYHFSHAQKASREKRLVEIELKRKQQAEKDKKKRHYEDLMKSRPQKESVKAIKQKEKKTQRTKQKKEQKQQEEPKGLWERFKRWLND